MAGAPNREMAIRKRILSIYNQTEKDFSTSRLYNDYLEEVEDIIFNLTERVDVEATEARVRAYEEEHEDQIIANVARRAEERLRDQQAQAGNGGPEELGGQSQAATSGTPPGMQYAPVMLGAPMASQPTPVAGEPQDHSSNGSKPLDEAEVLRRAMRAGGWTAEIGRKRALEEALGSLWVS